MKHRYLKIFSIGFIFIFGAQAQKIPPGPNYSSDVQNVYKTLYQLSNCDYVYEAHFTVIAAFAAVWHEYYKFADRRSVKNGQQQLSAQIYKLYNYIDDFKKYSLELNELYKENVGSQSDVVLTKVESYRNIIAATQAKIEKIWRQSGAELILQADNHLPEMERRKIQVFESQINDILADPKKSQKATEAFKKLQTGIDEQLIKTLKRADFSHGAGIVVIGLLYLLSDYVSDRDHFGGLRYKDTSLKLASQYQLHEFAQTLVDQYGYIEAQIALSIFKGMHNCK